MMQEISRITIPLSRNEEASLSWHNSILIVHTEKDIHFYEFSYNLQCLDKKLDFISQSISVSRSSPLKGLIPDQLLKESVKHIHYNEMILDPALWPHNQQLVDEMTNISDIQWSPVGFLTCNESGLAVLNNIGSVEVYGRARHKWASILDLSEIVKQKYSSSKEFVRPKTLLALKELAYALETSAICWGPKLENRSCLFITAQKNGDVLVWILMYNDREIIPELLGETQTEMGEVISMIWISKPGKEFVIICSNVHGQIFALNCCISDDNFELKIIKTVLWPQKDKMVVKYMCYDTIDDKIVLISNKHRHLMVIIIDKNCQVITNFVRNVNDYRITDIKSKSCGIFLTTVNCKIYKIVLKVLETDLDFDLQLIKINEDLYVNHEVCGVAFSFNNVICALAMKNRKILHRQRAQKTCDIVFFSTNQHPDELTLLMQNQTQKLTNHWDCIELLRYKTMKTKMLPSIDYDYLYKKADNGIYELKLYLVYLNFFLSMEKLVKNRERKTVPEMSIDNVKEKILALHASQSINKVHESRRNDEEMLEGIQLATYLGAKKYLSYYCSKSKREMGDFVNTTEMMADLKYMFTNEEEIICQCCDETLNGFTCSSGHFNIFCSLTFAPIEDDYLVCRGCGATAKSELYSNNPMCIFCDLYLNDVSLPTKINF